MALDFFAGCVGGKNLQLTWRHFTEGVIAKKLFHLRVFLIKKIDYTKFAI
jgi:hypothetical protein